MINGRRPTHEEHLALVEMWRNTMSVPWRTGTVLAEAGFTCIDDLAGLTETQLKRVRGVGNVARKHVQELLERHGRELTGGFKAKRSPKPAQAIELGKRLAALRIAKGITQHQLGETFGVRSNQIARWERGADSPRVPMIVALGCFYDVDLHWLLTGKHWVTTRKNGTRDFIAVFKGAR